MNIEIIGNKSSNQMKLIKNIKKALEILNIDTNIMEVVNSKKYKIKNTPALVINDTLISEGKVLNEREISRYIKEYAYNII